MTKLLPLDQEILDLLAQNPNGLSAVVLLEKLPSSLNQRSLQRHLVRLIDSGKVTRHGKARSTHYKAYLTDEIKPPTGGVKEIDLSPEAIKIQSAISQTYETRNKVGYKYITRKDIS